MKYPTSAFTDSETLRDQEELQRAMTISENRLGVMPIDGPRQVIEKATEIATQLASIIKDRKLFNVIKGREFVRVEGWNTLGAMLGILPREVSVVKLEDGSYEATVELIRTSDGAVVGRASSLCGMDEIWADRAEYARRSMAVTRATGKAFRLGFSWIMSLAGYEPTPAEEMPSEPEKWEAETKAKTENRKSPTFITDKQRKRLFAIARQSGLDNDAILQIIGAYGYESAAEITRYDYQKICNEIEGK